MPPSNSLKKHYFQDDEDVVSIALEDIVVGEEYEGVINNVVTYGAFVDIGTEVRLRVVQSWLSSVCLLRQSVSCCSWE